MRRWTTSGGIPTATSPSRRPGGSTASRTVILALGRRGTPRKLDVPGEELPKVMYSLIEAEAYTDKRILVVGGGDSAVEAAMGLAYQKGNKVILSYRQAAFSRIKERNAKRLEECRRAGSLEIVLGSRVTEIRPRSVLLEAGGTDPRDPQRLRLGVRGWHAAQRLPRQGRGGAGIPRPDLRGVGGGPAGRLRG